MMVWLRLLPVMLPGSAAGVVRKFPQPSGDRQLIAEIREDPHRGWSSFLDRYAQDLLVWIRHLGFDGDEAMDRFVFVCEILAEDRCRRLREIRHLGDRGELVPWLREVVRNAVVSWYWSQHGRQRLPKAIAALGEVEQRVFQAHYWEGLGPVEIRERLESEGRPLKLSTVFDALETIFSQLSDGDRWRLSSSLLRRLPALELEALPEAPATSEGAEETVLKRERHERAGRALSSLEPGERLLLQLRYEESCTYREMGTIAGCDTATARRRTGRVLKRLRDLLEESVVSP